jgi:hypothetical protein
MPVRNDEIPANLNFRAWHSVQVRHVSPFGEIRFELFVVFGFTEVVIGGRLPVDILCE